MGDTSTATALLKYTSEGPAWHGPAVLDTLRSVNADEAAARPVPAAHTIWEILNHMIAWQEYAVRALEGVDAPILEGEANWPPVAASDADAWAETVARFEASNRRVQALLSEYDDARLRETIPGRDYTFKILVNGLQDHNIYHQGQIALIKKALG